MKRKSYFAACNPFLNQWRLSALDVHQSLIIFSHQNFSAMNETSFIFYKRAQSSPNDSACRRNPAQHLVRNNPKFQTAGWVRSISLHLKQWCNWKHGWIQNSIEMILPVKITILDCLNFRLFNWIRQARRTSNVWNSTNKS